MIKKSILGTVNKIFPRREKGLQCGWKAGVHRGEGGGKPGKVV